MKLVVAKSSLFGMVLAANTILSSDAIAQRCIDPPTNVNGKCSKQAGATCDPVSRRWINGSKRAYDACMAAAGAKPTYNDSYKNIKR
jgi:hypothetical protein